MQGQVLQVKPVDPVVRQPIIQKTIENFFQIQELQLESQIKLGNRSDSSFIEILSLSRLDNRNKQPRLHQECALQTSQVHTSIETSLKVSQDEFN